MIRVCFPFVGDSVGGSHVSAALLIAGLDRHRFDPVVVLHRQEGPLAPWLRDQGIAFEAAPAVVPVSGGSLTSQGSAMAKAAGPLAAFLRRRGVGVVHTNDARMHQTWLLAARLAGARQVWHQRTADDSRRNAVYSRLAARVMTISEHCRASFPPGMRRRATALFDPFVVPDPPPDRAAARQALMAELAAPEPAALVGFIGNLARQKRPLVFVEAMARLRERLAPRPLLCPLIGDIRPGEGDEVRAAIAARGLEGTCLLLGPRFPVDPVLAGLDVLVAPGVNEGLGRTPVEAMLAGVPVVASAHGGHLEVIRHGLTGLLVAADDPGAFADALTAVLTDPAMAGRMAAEARSDAVRRFAASIHCRRMEDIYHDLAA